MRRQSCPSPLPCERSSSASTYRQSMMPNPEPLTARATSKGKQKLLLTSEHVSWCPPEFVESVRTRNLSRANELHFRGYESGKKTSDPCGFDPLLRNPLDDEAAEFRQLVSERQEVLEGRGITVSLDFFKAVPLLNDHARFRRLSFNRGGLASGGKEFSASRLDRGLGLWNVILQIRFLVRHIDFDHLVDGRLGLGVKPLNRDRAKSEAREHRKRNRVLGFHGSPP